MTEDGGRKAPQLNTPCTISRSHPGEIRFAVIDINFTGHSGAGGGRQKGAGSTGQGGYQQGKNCHGYAIRAA